MLSVCFMKTESHFNLEDYKLPKSKWSLRKRVWIFSAIYLSLALVEHLLSFAAGIKSKENREKNPLELFFLENYSFMANRLPIPNSVYLGIALEYLSFTYTFYWNFLNLFIILISMGISFLYENIYYRCKTYQGLMIDESLWAEIRSHHVKVSELTNLFNLCMNEMITIACFNDGYFVLNQIVNIKV